MKKGKVFGKILGTALMFLMIGVMLGGLPSAVDAGPAEGPNSLDRMLGNISSCDTTCDGSVTVPLSFPAPSPTPWLRIYTLIPPDINQVNYSQTVEELNFTYTVSPSEATILTDEYGNTYRVACWEEEFSEDELTVNMEAIIRREVGTTPVTTSDTYPIPESLLPSDIKDYLYPDPLIQSDHPTIINLAQTLSQGLTKEIDVVNSTLNWISENLRWICPCDPEYNVEEVGAIGTLERGGGNCIDFAEITIALLRAQGIPARYVTEILGYEHSNPGYSTPVEGSMYHANTEVYFPEVGWVRYGPPYLPPVYIPYGIPMSVSRGPASGVSSDRWDGRGISEDIIDVQHDWDDSEWHLEKVEDGEVKLIYTSNFTFTFVSPPLEPTIAFSPTSFNFSATEGEANPADQTLSIWNSGSGTLDWTVEADADWLGLTPPSGSSTGSGDVTEVTVSVDIADMSANAYSATITISAPGDSNTPKTVPVTLQVTSGPAEDDILAYYRGLGLNPDVVETTDLLQAINDWANGTIPPGFAQAITTLQLLQLIGEWAGGG